MNKKMWVLGGVAATLPIGWWVYRRLAGRSTPVIGSDPHIPTEQCNAQVVDTGRLESFEDLSELSYMRRVAKGSAVLIAAN